ncbi:hypothetical protein [Aquimarina rubra]|uniref:Lipoprotein n=1 Tax=Aquimarina rubra TaxID=1920033 RepID=A0ABW5LHB6_9FLAO
MRLKYSIVNLTLLIAVSSCVTFKNQKSRRPIIHELIILGEESGDISIKYFKKRHAINDANQIIEKEFIWDSIKNDMVYSGKSIPIELTTLVNYDTQNNKFDSERVVIQSGFVTGTYKAHMFTKEKGFDSIKTIEYEKGSISGELKILNVKDSILYQTTFKKGNGYWKDYYYKESKLRGEGKVKNNYKEGEWKYYNVYGNEDSTKTYTLNDAVDVRYPHCFFNKKEPCY